jgi:succinate dehydrogenase/fumarate reductase cytochrome b subunit
MRVRTTGVILALGFLPGAFLLWFIEIAYDRSNTMVDWLLSIAIVGYVSIVLYLVSRGSEEEKIKGKWPRMSHRNRND